jgi:hypothetical protein
MEDAMTDRAKAAELLARFDERHAEMEELLMEIADVVGADQDVVRMKNDVLKDWLYEAFAEKFGEDD